MRKKLFTSEAASEKHAGMPTRQKTVAHDHFNDPSLILDRPDSLFLSPLKSEDHG